MNAAAEPRTGPAATPHLTVLSRDDCPLCEHMLEELRTWLRDRAPVQFASAGIELRDVDADPELARRYGLRIPVLMLGDARVCEGRFDPAELLRLLRPRPVRSA